MRYLIPALLPALLLQACAGSPQAPEANEAPAAVYVVYGDTITAQNAITAADLYAAMAAADSLDVKVEGEIVGSCAKKGCWMTVKLPQGEPLFVKFRDYGFFVPKEGLEGKVAIMEGRAKRTVTDVAMLRHYAEDAGKSAEEIAAIVAPDTSWTFMADGVLIRR